MIINKQLNYYWLIYVAVVIAVVTTLFFLPSLWYLAIGPLHMKQEGTYPFLDLHGRLASMKAYAEGLNILYEPNPYDPLNRVSVKPTWYLWLGYLGIGPSLLIPIGIITTISYIFFNFLILKPKRKYQTLICILAACSPASLLAIERANDDIIYYSLIISWLYIIDFNKNSSYYISTLFINIIAPAKYYPGAAFLIFLYKPKNLKIIITCFTLTILFLIAYIAFYIEEIKYLSKAVPSPKSVYSYGLEMFLDIFNIKNKIITCFVLLIAIIPLAIKTKSADLNAIPIKNIKFFITSVGILTFCYLLNTNYDYRLIYTIPCIPLLFCFIECKNKILKQMAIIAIITLIAGLYIEQIAFFIAFNPETNIFEITSKQVQTNIKLKNIFLFINMFIMWYIAIYLLIAPIRNKPNLNS